MVGGWYQYGYKGLGFELVGLGVVEAGLSLGLGAAGVTFSGLSDTSGLSASGEISVVTGVCSTELAEATDVTPGKILGFAELSETLSNFCV